MKIILGIPVSTGIVTGPAYILNKDELMIPEYYIADVPLEMERLEKAILTSGKEISRLSEAGKNKCPEELEMLEAYRSILNDPELLNLARSFMINENRNAEYCFHKAAEHFVSLIETIDSQYIKERANDIREISALTVTNLLGMNRIAFHDLKSPSIIVSKSITVNEMAGLNKKMILGFITEKGGATDHAAILARAYGIPFITGLPGFVSEIDHNDELIMDGNRGKIIIHPDQHQRSEFIEEKDKWKDFYVGALSRTFETATTSDGRKIKIYANLSDKGLTNDAIRFGADGIGLLRTEFLFPATEEIPDEETQFNLYASIADELGGKELIIRTLDIGSDKKNSTLEIAKEVNPALGLRGLRLCLQNEVKLFKPQIKAILRAACKRNIRLMLPMVTSVEEVKKFKTLLDVCKMELKDKYIRHDNLLSIGVMIEVPSAAIMADAFADEVDFFSIGTNDLIQYTLAVDRVNNTVSYLTEELHPAVVELMRRTIKSAHKKNKTVTVCGELAGDPWAIPVLVGLGVDKLSVAPSSVPVVKEIVRSMSYVKARTIAQHALKINNKEKIQALTCKLLPKILQ